MSFDDAVLLVLKALVNARVATSEEKREDIVNQLGEIIELGYIMADEKVFRKLTPDQIREYGEKYREELLKS